MAELAPSRFRVSVLGSFEVWREDRPLGAAGWQRSAGTLLKLLVTSREQRRLRDEVIDTLWPDATPEGGANNLRYVLSVLRRHLGGGDPSPILADRTWVRLNPVHAWDIDLARFEELAGRAAGDSGVMEELAALYRVEPLIEDRYEDWATPLRAHIQRTWLQTCRRCAEALRARRELEPALLWLERALETEPLDEGDFQQVLQILIESGRRSEAMKRFQEFEKRLRSELGIEPSPETHALLSRARDWRENPVGPPARRQSHSRSEQSTACSSRSLPPGAYLGALPTIPLVSRQEELRRLMAGIDGALEGRGRLMLLAGEPGVGKTRLAQEVTTALHQRGFTVAAGRCYEPESAVPYYPFLDVLAEMTRLAPQELRAEIPGRWPYLLRLLPELQPVGMGLPPASSRPIRTRSLATTIAPPVDQDEPLLIRAVAGFLGAAAGAVPLAILLDDLHWSDSASMKLLLHLARHSGGQRLFLLGTYRDLDVPPDHPLHGALIDLGRERLMEKIALARLNSEGTEALISEMLDGATLPPGLVEVVHRPADGNPFFVGEVVRSMLEEGDLVRKNGEWQWRQRSDTRVPESVRAVLGQRLSRLPEETRAVLSAASVLGQTFCFEEVERVSGLPEAGVEAALEEATRAGLVRETRPDVYAFSHVLAQRAVYTEMTGRKQRRLHLVAAETIEAGPERERRAVEIASHFIQAGKSARAIPYSILAGDAARDVFAHTEAERHFRSAVEASQEIGDTAHEAAALERLAATLLRQARYPDAEVCAREAGEMFRRLGDQEGEAQATCRLSETLQVQGRQRDALAALQALTNSMDVPSASSAMVQLYMRQSELAMELGQHEHQGEMAGMAVQIAKALGDRRLLHRAELSQQGALWFMGRPNHVFGVFKEYVRILEEDGDLVQIAELAAPFALMAMLRGELQFSKEYGERALNVARQIGDPRMFPTALSQVAISLFLLGDWQAARAHLERAIAMTRSIDAATDLTIMLCNLGHLAVCEGDWDAGEALLREAVTVIQGTDARDSNQLPHLFLANLDLLRGDPRAAIQRLTPLLDRSGYEELSGTPLLPPLAHAYLDLGDVERAELLIRDALRRTESNGNRLDGVAALLVHADVLQKQGRQAESRATLRDVVRHAREMSFPAAEAEAVFKLGSLELESGDLDAARSSIIQAREIWKRLGARKDVERTGKVLAKLASHTVD